ncbi:hypothetical protein Tco_0278229 [Tanacetum coccineum]
MEPSYIFKFVGIRWLGAKNSMIHFVNGDFSTSLYDLLRHSSFLLIFSSSSSKVRRIGVIGVPALSLCCLMMVSSDDIASEMLGAACQAERQILAFRMKTTPARQGPYLCRLLVMSRRFPLVS